MRRTDGEVLLLGALPVVGVIWLSAFLLFPGFVQPMSPTMSAEAVAAFYRDPENLPRIRYSMILFNWFAVGFVPILALIVLQIRRMAHRTPIFSYAILACAAGGPTIFLMANLFWLLAARDWTGSALVGRIAGFEGIVCGLSAIYLAMAEVLNEVRGRKILLIGEVNKDKVQN